MSTVPSLCFKTFTAASVRAEASELIHKFNTAIQSIKRGESQDPFSALSQALGDASAQSARVTLPSMVRDDAFNMLKLLLLLSVVSNYKMR